MKLNITNIQPFSLHDGPGIRTTVFLSGCPLRCVWCHNPETQNGKAVLAFEEGKCTSCTKCTLCKNGVHLFGDSHKILREKCTLCGRCIDACPSNALSLSQRCLEEDEYLEIVKKQKRIVGNNGGITFSGGEPLFQGENFFHFLSLTDIHKAVETCGYADEAMFCHMLSLVDYVMFDIKLFDTELHRKYTGVTNELILKNLAHLRESKKSFIIRTPLIPGITDTEKNLSAIREIVGDDPWQTLPYNILTPSKYERIGRRYRFDDI